MLAVVRGAAQSEFSEYERTGSPWVMADIDRPIDERTDRQLKLAAIAESSGDLVRAARHFALACQGAMTLTSDRTLSAPACVRARALADQHDIIDVKIFLKVAEATIRGWTFDFQGAISLLKQAIVEGASLNPDSPDSSPLVAAHQMLGTIYSERGQFGEAEREMIFARDHCRAQGSAGCVAYANIYLCRMYVTLGDYGPARTACDTARAVDAIQPDRLVQANLNWIQGTLEAALGRHEVALEWLQKAWANAQMRGAEILRPILAQAITDSLLKLGRVDEAERWQDSLEKGLKAGTVPFFFGPQIAARHGRIALIRGRYDDALTGYTAASKSILHEMSIHGYLGMALANRGRGDLPAARAALEDAIAKIEKSRTNTSGAALRASYLTLHAGAYNELIGVRWDTEGAAAAGDALQIAEQGRARSLLDALMSAQVEGAAAPTLDAKAVQATLGQDEVLVEYVSLDDRQFAITVTPDRIAFNALPNAGAAAELSTRVDFFADLVQENDEASLVPAAKRLYADVLAPALDGVPSTAHTLIIAADGPLHRLPFDAIGDSPRVIERWNVVTVPSASALASRARHTAPSEAALVVAAPTDSQGRGTLAAAPAEADAIRQRIGGTIEELSGTGATQQQLEASGLGKFAVLHFASHAVVDENKPLQSALILAPGAAGGDRQWTAEEIYRTPLNADLVVLSACSTGAGAETPGEGVMSLARAFLYAGAGATVATLWNVPDAPGPVFADVLYRELAAGRPLGVSVADARRELRRLGAPPQAWAAYVLTGKPGATVRVTPRMDRSISRAGVAGGIAIMLLVLALVMRGAARALWRFRWPAPALASGVLAIVAAVQFIPVSTPRLDAMSRIARGSSAQTLTTTLVGDHIAWTTAKGADAHQVEMFDADGMPAGPPAQTASPFTIPADAKAGWIRVTALHAGQTLAQSTLIPIPRH
jgi:CHAT domain-containing protein